MEIICQTLIAVSLIALQPSGKDVQSRPTTPANPGGNGVFRVGNNVTPPVLVSKTEPEYSEEARRAKYQGTAMLYVQIDPSGGATHIRVIKSLGLGLDRKAVEAVAKWKFQPGYKEGKPVTVEATIEVNFRLLGDGWTIAREAFLRFGKGRHRAALNFGDCASYALAKARDLPLLFKGGDFSETDLSAAA